MAVNRATIKKLQTAINRRFGVKLLLNSRQFYTGTSENRPITLHTISQQVYDKDKGKEIKIDLFKSYSYTQLAMFLRDYWYQLNGWEIPYDETWEEVKRKYAETEKPVRAAEPAEESCKPPETKSAWQQKNDSRFSAHSV